MTEAWFLPDFVFDGQDLQSDVALHVSDDRVIGLIPSAQAPASAQPLTGIISTGFIDLQVNGGGGFLFNADPTAETIAQIATAHRRYGTTHILPTVITDHERVLTQAVDAAIAAKSQNACLGIHIEGPHISVARRGTHSAEFVRPMDDHTMAHVRRLRDHDIPVMITVAPEATTPDQISQLANMGAIVSIGHSDASADETRAAIAAGARCATHLFNAMSPMLNRAPGVTGAVINSDIAAGVIVDGIHVADEMIALALRARPKRDCMFIVSDAMPTVGGPDHFNLYGMHIKLDANCLVNAEGSLAGAHITQAQGVYRLHNDIGLDQVDALRAGITIPARVIEQSHLTDIRHHRVSDLIQLGNDLSFTGYLAP